jgi:hypothetical protein
MPSYVRLSERFWEEVTQHPVPIDLEALRALRGSPCASTSTPGSPTA